MANASIVSNSHASQIALKQQLTANQSQSNFLNQQHKKTINQSVEVTRTGKPPTASNVAAALAVAAKTHRPQSKNGGGPSASATGHH